MARPLRLIRKLERILTRLEEVMAREGDAPAIRALLERDVCETCGRKIAGRDDD